MLSVVRLRIVCVMCVAVVVLLLPSVCAVGEVPYGAVGVSNRGDSRIVLAVVDGSICYGSVNWSLFSAFAGRDWWIHFDGVELCSGRFVESGVLVVSTNVTVSGVHSYAVGIASWERVLKVVIINASAEEWIVREHERAIGLLKYSAVDMLMSVLKAHAITIVFLVVPLPFVFKFVVDRKEREARRVV